MKPIVESDGKQWFQIETQEEADEEGRLAEHAVGMYFSADAKRGTASRYYTLRSGDSPLVTVRIPDPGQEGVNPWLLTSIAVAPRNADPYPDNAAAIEALSEAIGVALPPECYPYARRAPVVPGL